MERDSRVHRFGARPHACLISFLSLERYLCIWALLFLSLSEPLGFFLVSVYSEKNLRQVFVYVISLIICTVTHSGDSGVSTDRGGARLLFNPCALLVWKEGSLTLVPGKGQRCSRLCRQFPDLTSRGYLYETHSLGIILNV